MGKAVTIIGPTGVGKTKVAFELARRVSGEVINLDKIFTFKHFPIASGLSDSLKEKGVRRHLYAFLEPSEPIIPVPQYIKMVEESCADILARGGTPIIEGGSTTYFPGLYEANEKTKFCNLIIGLEAPKEFNSREKYKERIEEALRDGLLDEAREGLKKYRHTLVMEDAHCVVPLVRHLDGAIDLATAKEEILDLCLQYAARQLETFKKYPGVLWIEYEPARHAQVVEQIQKLAFK